MPLNHFICSCCGKSKPIDQRILLGGDALCLCLRRGVYNALRPLR